MQIIRRNRLGNDTEDITTVSSLLTGSSSVAAIDGYDVINIQTAAPLESTIKTPLGSPTQSTPLAGSIISGTQATGAQPALGPTGRPAPKLFDVLGLAIKAAPRGIAFAASKNMFVFNDDAQTGKLFFTDQRGIPRGSIDVQYPQAAPDFVEALDYIPATARTFGDSLVMVAIYLDDTSPSGLQSRLQIIDLSGRVLSEIIPQPEISQLFLTGVAVKSTPKALSQTFLLSSDDDNIIHEIDLKGREVAQFTPPTKQRGFNGIEGLVTLPSGEVAAANGFAGLLEVFSPIDTTTPQVIDYRIGPGLSLPAGLAWDSTTNEFLLLSLTRLNSDDRFVARLTPALDSFRLAINSDPLARKVTYLPDEQLIAVAHANTPRGIQLFNEQGQPAGVIDTTQLGAGPPVILNYLPETREFGIVFRNGPQSQLMRLKRDGTGFSNAIDFAAAGIQKISAVTFFNPAQSGSGQFLVFDNTQDLFVTTDFAGAKLSGPFSIRNSLRVLNPTAVTAITSGPDAGAFAICNAENSEVVVFRLD
jgi:hypothetical protein